MSKKKRKVTYQDLNNGVMNNYNNMNLRANYVNDFIEFKNDKEAFKQFIKEKYERMAKENEQKIRSNIEANRKNEQGNQPIDNKTNEPGKPSQESTERPDSPKTTS